MPISVCDLIDDARTDASSVELSEELSEELPEEGWIDRIRLLEEWKNSIVAEHADAIREFARRRVRMRESPGGSAHTSGDTAVITTPTGHQYASCINSS